MVDPWKLWCGIGVDIVSGYAVFQVVRSASKMPAKIRVKKTYVYAKKQNKEKSYSEGGAMSAEFGKNEIDRSMLLH